VSDPLHERTRAVVERYLAALNAHDPDAIAACVDEDFVNEHTSALGTTVRGKAAYRERLPLFLGQFRDLHYDAEDWIVDGDRCAVAYTMSCQYVDGERWRPVVIRGMFRFRVARDVIVHRVDYWDGTEFSRQVQVEASS
jgi:ketosteroid isomerase-like protein